jgi:hypothetical protein
LKPDLCVTHRGGVVAVDRAKVSLAFDERIPKRELLRHADDRVIHCRVTVRMIFTDRIADDAGRFFIRLIVGVPKFIHRPQHPPVDGFKPIPDIRKCSADNDRHGVVEIRPAHLVFDIDLVAF